MAVSELLSASQSILESGLRIVLENIVGGVPGNLLQA